MPAPGRGGAITFLLPGEEDLEALRRLSPDSGEAHFRRGERAWILQTFLRLRDAGHPVVLVGEVPRGAGLLVFHTKHRTIVSRAWRRLAGSVLVAVRADGRESAAADVEVLQNGRFADGERRFFVPHWPQPDLLPRDETRAETIRTVAYKGLTRHLAPAFRDDDWRAWLAARGLTWVSTDQDWADRGIDTVALDWHDYRTVDLLLAVRPADRRGHTSKPASKLVNAWRAGCPALLGPEVAYRELRRSELDYLEVDGVDAARQAIERLRLDPALFRAMVSNGRRRAAEFSPEAILAVWEKVIFREVPRASARLGIAGRHPLLRLPLWGFRAVGRVLSGRPTR